MARMRPALALEQGRFVGTYDPYEGALVEFTVPLVPDEEFFRIGWSLKGLGHTGWIAIATGQNTWRKDEMHLAADHIRHLLEESGNHCDPSFPGRFR